MSLTITFTLGEDSCTLPAPSARGKSTINLRQSENTNAANTRLVSGVSDSAKIITEIFECLTDIQKQNLETFYKDTALGMKVSFSYTDVSSSVRTVRFASGVLEFERIAGNVWNVVVELEETDE
jgi:hypothetical protein